MRILIVEDDPQLARLIKHDLEGAGYVADIVGMVSDGLHAASTISYDALIVETRGMKGPRTYEMTGIPLHDDNQTIVRERIYLDKTDPNMLHDEITTIDHALTRPWTVTKDYRRTPTSQPIWWSESVCAENNVHISIRDEVYFLSGDGHLMPSKKDQPPPDLRYFNRSRK